MANSDYAAFAGFVQFKPSERTVNNQKVRSVVISAIGSNKRIDVTIWPDFDSVPLAQGDFIAVQGKYSERASQKPSGEQITYRNLSANKLIHLGNGSPDGAGAPKDKVAEVAQLAEEFDF